MAFLAIAAAVRWERPQKVAIGAILVLNVVGILLNYGAFRSTQYDVRAEIASCNYYSQPSYAFVASREEIRRRILTGLGVRTEFRTFP